MKRTELKRTGWQRKAPTNTDRKPRTPLRQRSKKREAHMRTDRVPKVKALIEAGAPCEMCPAFAAAGITTHCAGVVQGLHERRKSGAGGSRLAPQNLMGVCNWSNVFTEDNPKLVRDLFGTRFVVREGDPEWDELSIRWDRLG